MSEPIYLQDYTVESEQGNVNYSVVGALPNEMPGVETKQYTWNFVSHMILEKCTRFIRIKYDFKDTEFQKEITFEYKLMGTVQLGSKVYNAGDIMTWKYNKELLEMELTILFPVDEKICGNDLSWNIFIKDCEVDTYKCPVPSTSFCFPYGANQDIIHNNWYFTQNTLYVKGSDWNYSSYTFTVDRSSSGNLKGININTTKLVNNYCCNLPNVTVKYGSTDSSLSTLSNSIEVGTDSSGTGWVLQNNDLTISENTNNYEFTVTGGKINVYMESLTTSPLPSVTIKYTS